MFHTPDTYFGLRTISLMDRSILIFKALPIVDKTAQYVPSFERAIDHTIAIMGVSKSHECMYVTKKDLIEAVYRRR